MKNEKIVSSFMWKFFERTSTQIINMVVQIILARLIAPEEFGALAILVVFVNIANIFVQKGFSSSLIRNKDASTEEYNTVLTVSLAISACLYALLVVMAPWLAAIYEIPSLTSGLRIIALQLFCGSFYCVQNAILVREMRFKAIFVRGFIATSVSGIVGIVMAIQGFGLWALVVQSLLNQLLLCIVTWSSISWRPKLYFNKQRFQNIFSFGGKILVSELISYGVESLRTLLIGGYYSDKELSFYDRGQTYPATLMRGIHDTVSGVMLPYFSKKQNDKDALSKDFLISVSLSMFIIAPVFAGMAAVSTALIYLLLTETWAGAVPYFLLFCIYQIPYPIQSLSRQVIYARGKSNFVLQQEIIKAVIAIVTLVVALPFGVMAVAISALITMYLTTLVNIFYTKKLIPFKVTDMVKCLWKTALGCIVMFFVVWSESSLPLPQGLILLIQIVTGIVVYVVISIILKNQNIQYLMKIIKKK